MNYCTTTPRTFPNMLPHFTHLLEPVNQEPASWHIVSPP